MAMTHQPLFTPSLAGELMSSIDRSVLELSESRHIASPISGVLRGGYHDSCFARQLCSGRRKRAQSKEKTRPGMAGVPGLRRQYRVDAANKPSHRGRLVLESFSWEYHETIPAGQVSATFPVTVIDDAPIDGKEWPRLPPPRAATRTVPTARRHRRQRAHAQSKARSDDRERGCRRNATTGTVRSTARRLSRSRLFLAAA